MGEIASASREQSDGIAQVNRAVLQMDDSNQQNAGMVEQATAATESLKDQANALVSAIGRFKAEARAHAAPKAAQKSVADVKANADVKADARRPQPLPRRTQSLPAQDNAEWTEF